MKSKVILISHNEYAYGLKKTLEMITGSHDHLYAFGLMPGDHPDDLINQVEELISTNEWTFILGDIAGGSVCNAALRLTLQEGVCLISGMNLPLAIQLVLMPPSNQAELHRIIEISKDGLKSLVLESAVQVDEDFF